MAFNLFHSKTSQIGIDIGTSAIKIVELTNENKRWSLLNYGIFRIHGGDGSSDTSQSILNLPEEEIAQHISATIQSAGIKSKSAIASISSFSTFATVIEMPYVSEEDLAKTIPFEARKYVPVPLDQVILDWSIVGVADKAVQPSPSGTSVEVFLAAVPKDETAKYQRIMRLAGIELKALELENSSLIRALLGNDLSQTAIVNIGGRSTTILIVSRGYERVNHTYEIGGYEMTMAASKGLDSTLAEAEEYKRTKGLISGNNNSAYEAIARVVDTIIQEIQRTIQPYEDTRDQKVERVVFVGGVSDTPGLLEYVKGKLGRDVLMGNVFARLQYPSELTPIVGSLSNTLAIAVGAALRES